MSEHDPIHIGQVIASQFNILRKLGAGGMGAVYLAEQLGMDRKVVVKVMHPELTAGSSQAVERFRREAKAVAQLNHPNIVQVYVFGQTPGGQMYLAMEYIEGRDLSTDLERGVIEQPRALKILDQVCSALIEAHAAGIVHRDLKPDNIMLTDRHGNPDYVKVLDFGIAKMADPGAASITQAGAVFGTPRYMAPEQAKGKQIDARADIYALGVVLYEMLAGMHPFREATTALEYIVKHATEEIPPLGVDHAELHITPRIDALLSRCLAKEPDARFQSARELQREVRLALRDFPEAARGFPTEGTHARPAPVPTAPEPAPTSLAPTHVAPSSAAPAAPKRGTPAWVWAAIAVVVVGGAVAAAVLASSGPAPGLDPTRDTAAATVAAATDAGRVVAAGDPDPRTAEAPPPTAQTDIAEGMPIDGFPIPARARITTSTPQVEMLESDLSGAAVIAFYKAKLAGRYGDLQDIPNGLMIAGAETPFSTVSVMNGADTLNIVLSRNALAKSSGPKDLSGKTYFGVAAISDASVIAKMDNVAVLRSRKAMREVCAFYTSRYSEFTGVVTVQDVEADPPYCNMAAGADAETDWQAIAVVDDPTSKGAVMISISAKQ
jgi:serine/threonine-protein kinase